MISSPVVTAASARVVGIPNAYIASETIYSLNTGADPRPAVGLAGIGCATGSLELNISAATIAINQFTKQVSPAVAQSWNPSAELMPGIHHCDRVGTLGHPIARQRFNSKS